MRKGMCLTRNRYPFSAGITVQFHPKYAYVALSESDLYQQHAVASPINTLVSKENRVKKYELTK